MDFIEIEFKVSPLEEGCDILIAQLSEIDFESFVNTEEGLKAYIPATHFSKDNLKNIQVLGDSKHFSITYSLNEIPAQNWNAVWESNFEPIVIAGRCYVRAPFHPAKPEFEYEMVIEPKMSFGTAHHETTSMMIQLMMDLELKGKSLLDMGCGTGILAIMAHKMGAIDIMAIDNDKWAIENTHENIDKNNSVITVVAGDAKTITGMKFDVILANINRNILLNDIPSYAKSMNKNGLLLMSGFYENDLQAICKKAEDNGLICQKHLLNNDWVATLFVTK